jgi:serine/threonine protein kinase
MTKLTTNIILLISVALINAAIKDKCTRDRTTVQVQNHLSEFAPLDVVELFGQTKAKAGGASGEVVVVNARIGNVGEQVAIKRVILPTESASRFSMSEPCLIESEIRLLKELSSSTFTPKFFGCFMTNEMKMPETKVEPLITNFRSFMTKVEPVSTKVETVYIIMEAFKRDLDDDSFKNAIQSSTDKNALVQVIKSLFNGLEMLADKGIIHHDIKPKKPRGQRQQTHFHYRLRIKCLASTAV